MRNVANCSFPVFDRSCGRRRSATASIAGLRVHEQGDNETVETQDFGENENQNHSDEQPGLLGGSTHTGVTDDSDGESCGHAGQTDGKAGAELDEVRKERRLLFQTVRDENGDDETVDTDDTSHDDGNDVCGD